MKIAINPSKSNVTETPVLCKDGTTQIQLSSPNAEYIDTCINNGGRAVNQAVVNAPVKTQNNKTKEPIYYILVTAGVMIAGYFCI